MALSGSVKTNSYDGRYYTLSWTATQSISDNQSTINWTLSCSGGSVSWYAERTLKAVIAGVTVADKTDRVERKAGTISSGSFTVTHASDGTFGFTVDIQVAVYDSTINCSGDGTFSLNKIPRQATITSAPNFSDEENPTIYYSNPAGTAVTSLMACISLTMADADVSYRDISKTGTTYTFKLTDEERETLRNAAKNSNSITVYFYIRTIISGVSYFSYLNRTFTINDANPIITATVIDTNSTTITLTGDNKKLVKYHSDAKATMTAEAQKGASIDEDSYVMSDGHYIKYGTSNTFDNVERNTFIFTVSDSRGNSTTEIVEPTMVDYIDLTCNIANNRPDALGNMTVACSGNYFNGSFGAVTNTLTVQYRYCVSGGSFSNWVNMTATKNGNSYYASADIVIPNFNQQLYYTFETRAIDKLSTITSTESAVKSLPLFHWGENDFVFEVPVTFNAGVVGATSTASTESDTYEGSKTITGNLRLKGTGNYGNHLLFGDSNYCYIAELTDDVMTIKANKINLNASGGVYVDGYAIPILDKGVWTPSLNSSAVSSYTTQYGWYSKIGQSVTIGFYIKATCKSGYNSTSISISGVPFTPMYSAAGGGMCSGAYVAANQNFQCYVVETNKTITTRTQTCNNTTATNLTTSASGCWYRSSGGEITLSGTITFIANS